MSTPNHASASSYDLFGNPSSAPCFVNRLPFELLSYVFKNAEAGERVEHGRPVEQACAYRFCRVDTYWRSVALGTPSLWSWLCVQGGWSLLRAAAWLPHTKKCLINLYLISNPPAASWAAMMDVFGSHVDRVVDLVIQMENEDRSLSWSYGMTSLECLGLVSVSFDSVADTLELLRSCPRLEWLYMMTCTIRFNPPNDTALVPVFLPKLHFASLPLSRLTYILLHYLDTPTLDNVAIGQDFSYSDLRDNFDRTIVKQNPKALGPTYNFVQWNGSFPGWSAEKLGIFLRHLPQTEVLHVEHLSHAEDLIRFLVTPDDEGRFPCPRLRVLGFYNCSDWNGSYMAFEPRYRGRKDGMCTVPRPLERLIMDKCSNLRDLNRAIQMFQEFGTVFRFFDWDVDE